MKVVTAKEMREIDRVAIEERGMPGEVLMGYAGRALADCVLTEFPSARSIALCCGCGNNGGDGFTAAYFLHNAGREVRVFLAGDPGRITASTGIYREICRRAGIPVTVLNEGKIESETNLPACDLIVDALLGTGFSGVPRGAIAELIGLINRSGKPVVAADMPSGLPSDGEGPSGEAVRADVTVTMGLPKISLVTFPGKPYAGKVQVADIGFPRDLTASESLSAELVTPEFVGRHFGSPRDADTHKGREGHLLIIGGFDGMEGAALMSAMAAFASGAGLVTLLTTGNARNAVAGRVPELITSAFRNFQGVDQEFPGDVSEGLCGEDKRIPHLLQEMKGDLADFFARNRRYNAVLLGPGMGRTLFSSLVFEALIEHLPAWGVGKILVDGDGLYHLAECAGRKGEGVMSGLTTVLTPHWGEASRLLDITVDAVKRNRYARCGEIARRYGSVALLKGPCTIVSDGGRTLINTTGNPLLAAAGSGDVLAGIVGALLARASNPLACAGAGAYLHGLAADIIRDRTGAPFAKATDLVSALPDAFARSSDGFSCRP